MHAHTLITFRIASLRRRFSLSFFAGFTLARVLYDCATSGIWGCSSSGSMSMPNRFDFGLSSTYMCVNVRRNARHKGKELPRSVMQPNVSQNHIKSIFVASFVVTFYNGQVFRPFGACNSCCFSTTFINVFFFCKQQ